MRFVLMIPVLMLSACAAQQPEPQTAAVDQLVEELNLIPPPSHVRIERHCSSTAECVGARGILVR